MNGDEVPARTEQVGRDSGVPREAPMTAAKRLVVNTHRSCTVVPDPVTLAEIDVLGTEFGGLSPAHIGVRA